MDSYVCVPEEGWIIIIHHCVKFFRVLTGL